MTPFTPFDATVVLLPLDDVDTDQIIPARYLKCTDKLGLGAHLFEDRRTRPDFPPLAPAGAQILLAGANFGCGSSREHAPWGLVAWGFRALVARSFADIFRQNAIKNGLLPIALDEPGHARVMAARASDPALRLHVDLAAQRLAIVGGPGGDLGGSLPFPIDPFARHCLLNGVDELGYLLGFEPRITEYERQRA